MHEQGINLLFEKKDKQKFKEKHDEKTKKIKKKSPKIGKLTKLKVFNKKFSNSK